MGHVKSSIHIDAPVELAWKLSTDIARFPEWQTQFVAIRDLTGEFPAVGTSYTSVDRIAGREMESRWEVVEADPPRRLVQKLSMPGGHGTFTSWFEEAPQGGLTAWVEMQYELPGGFFGSIADKLFMERAIERSVRHTNENMKAMIEAEALVPA